MEITTSVNEGLLDVSVDGRLDGYWADHLDRALADVVRNGHHHVRLDCSRLLFMSSAGIAVLLKFHKELRRLSGSFQVVNPSKTVESALRLTRLTALLAGPATDTGGAPPDAAPRAGTIRHETRDGAAFDVYDLDRRARLACREIGSAAPLAHSAFRAEDCRSLESLAPAFALGVGAFGGGFDDCRSRFGEMISVAGATAYQPAGGTNVADYLVSSDGTLNSEVQLLYGLACEGGFSHLVRFDAQPRGATLALSRLLDACLSAAGAESIGFVLVAETASLVGAALRRSPADAIADADFFAHPGIRARLAFTAEPAFTQGVTLAAGVVSREPGAARHAMLRTMGDGLAGHAHAAAFRFRPIRKGLLDLRETVAGLFESEALMGVLHLLHDSRGAAGAGDSELVRGACWVGPAAGPWETA